MKIVGVLLLLFGLLAIVGGLIVAVVSQVIPNEECELAAQYRSEADKLSNQADTARGTPQQDHLQKEALEKMHSAVVWEEGCRNRKIGTSIALIAGLAAGLVGFIMAIAGFFTLRKGRRAAL